MGKWGRAVIAAACVSVVAGVAVAQRMVRLRATIECTGARRSGFLGIGPHQRINGVVVNHGPVAGTFTATVIGHYPGGGRVLFARQAVSVPAGGFARIVFDFDVHQGGFTGTSCQVDSPMGIAP